MRNYFYLLFLSLSSLSLFAQKQNIPANSYQTTTNTYYWKNRKPYEGYWQQDVHYVIKATINEKSDIITGSEILIYTNNSPDELTCLYFHLYQNAFQPGSYLDALMKQNGVKPKWGKYEVDKLGTTISKLQQNGVDLKTELDNTILKVYLHNTLKPGESTTLELNFNTYFGDGDTRRRMKKFNSFGSTHYNGTHFYPRICVYDKKFGWDTQQHLNREFYGDFGQYDVELDFASNYIVEATGMLQNKDEVLPDSLRKKLDLKNFANKPWNSRPSVIIPYEPGKRKIWKYSAINVHDFAFTANPNYRIGESTWNNIQVIALVPESHAAFWQNAASYGVKIIKSNSEDFGMYAYPKMVIADAEDGMEYPMLTLNRGYDPNYRRVFAHEISHNWFFGMVGNNETYRAALDEGFTQFLDAWSLEKVDGINMVEIPPKSVYRKKYKKPISVRYTRVFGTYIKDALKDETIQLNTHSDDFHGALAQGGGYREVYYKTATMLFNLQYVLGDSLFLKAMQHYFNQWKMAHPYFEDFRTSIISCTKVDLNWFFDQWIETDKTIDYAIKNIRKGEKMNAYKISFERRDLGQMPIDFSVVSKTKKAYDFHIPNTLFVKETSATVLPKWYGWGNKLNPNYTAQVTIPGGISKVIIDSSGRLADYNRLNNSSPAPIRFGFDHQISNEASWDKYDLFWRPDIWYNGFDGIKAGVNFNGNYLNKRHIFTASIWYNSGIGQQKFSSFQKDFNPFSFRIQYSTAMRKWGKNVNAFAKIGYLDGLQNLKLGTEKQFNHSNTRIYLYYKSLFRADSSDLNYLIYADEWQIAKYNNSLNFGLEHSYLYSIGNGTFNFNSRIAAFSKSYSYSTLALTFLNSTRLWKFDLRTRFFIQYSIGSALPDESALYLAGENSEDMMDNKFVRSSGFFPSDWQGFGNKSNHFHYGGGLNLRAYAGYTPIEIESTNQYKVYKGKSGAAVNAELSFVRLFATRYSKIKNYFALDFYLFGDLGSIDYTTKINQQKFSTVRADAGVGALFTIKKWGILDKPSPLTLRFDAPFFLSRPPAEEPGYLKFRWIVAISKAF